MTKSGLTPDRHFVRSFDVRYSDFVISAQLYLRQFGACHAEALAKAGDSLAAETSVGD